MADVVAVAGHLEDSNPGQRGPGCHPNDDDDQQFQRKLLFQLNIGENLMNQKQLVKHLQIKAKYAKKFIKEKKFLRFKKVFLRNRLSKRT